MDEQPFEPDGLSKIQADRSIAAHAVIDEQPKEIDTFAAVDEPADDRVEAA